MSFRENPQTGFDEVVVSEQNVVRAAETFFDTKEAAKEHAAARKLIKQHIETLELKAGDVVRIGSRTLPIVERRGEEREVTFPEYSKLGPNFRGFE